MCYAQPGPRCFGHAFEKHQKSLAKLTELEAVSTEIQESVKKIAHKYPKNYKDRSDYKALQKKYSENHGKVLKQKTVVRDDRLDMDATTGGIESLNAQVNALNPAVPEQKEEHDNLALRLNVGKQMYDYKIIRYDYAKGTVNGRAPSGYGSDEGINILKRRVQALNAHPVAQDGPKKDRWEAKRNALLNQIEHAKATKSHAQAKITDYASATLEENRAKLQKIYLEQTQIKEKHEKANEAWLTGPEKKKEAFLAERRADGTPQRTQWSAWDRGKWDALCNESETAWTETVKPYSRRLEQLERLETETREKVMKGSITPKQRAEQRAASGAKTTLGKK